MRQTPTLISGLSDIEEIERQPLAERMEAQSTYGLLAHAAARHRDRPALDFHLHATADERPVSLTYGALFRRVTQTANLFHSLGVGPTEVVSFLLPNLPQTHYVLWGGEAAGIVNPVNPLLEPAQIAAILNAAQTRVLVTLAPFPKTDLWQKAEAVMGQVPSLKTVLTIDLAQFLPWWQRALVGLARLPDLPARWGAARGVERLDFDAAVDQQPDDRLVSGRVIAPDEVASYFHTGGTTGTPKLAAHTHFNEASCATVLRLSADVQASSVLLCALPLFHVNAVIVTGLAPFAVGARVVLLSPQGFRGPQVVPNFWRLVERYRATFFSGVPTAFVALLDVELGGADVSSLQYAVCGGAPMSVDLFHRFEQATGVKILEGYGLTEGTCVSSVNPAGGERRIGSVGFPLPYLDMKAVRLADDGTWERDCGVDEVGHIVLRGPYVFPGYKLDKDNRGVWVEEGWLNTGDLGRRDAEGYFWLTGRSKELIIRGGHNIDPAVIEEPLSAHPAVDLVAAVGQPDAYAGELPVAFVTLAEPPPGPTAPVEQELRAWAKERITERAAVPVRVEVVPEMPLTALGKIFKPALRCRASAQVLTEALRAEEIGARVAVAPHEKLGVLATVSLDDPARRADAEQVLGTFAIQYELSGSPAGSSARKARGG